MARQFTSGQYLGGVIAGLPNPAVGITVTTWAIFDTINAGDNNFIVIRVGNLTDGSPHTLALQLIVDDADVFLVNNTGGSLIVSSGVTITAGRVYHLAFSCDGVTSRVYIDGMERANSATLPGSGNPTTVITARYDNAFPDALTGKLWDMAIWTKALTPQEILELYRARCARGSIRRNDLYSWWPLNGADATAERAYDGRSGFDLSVVSATQWDVNPQTYYMPRARPNYDLFISSPGAADSTRTPTVGAATLAGLAPSTVLGTMLEPRTTVKI